MIIRFTPEEYVRMKDAIEAMRECIGDQDTDTFEEAIEVNDKVSLIETEEGDMDLYFNEEDIIKNYKLAAKYLLRAKPLYQRVQKAFGPVLDLFDSGIIEDLKKVFYDYAEELEA